MTEVQINSRGRMTLVSKRVPATLRAYEGQRRHHYSFPVCGDILRRLLANDPDLGISERLWERLDAISRQQAEALEIAGMDDACGDQRLRPYQRVAVKWLSTVRRGILADEQGLGKTVEACCAAAVLAPERALVICPTAKIGDWAEHVERWVPGARVARLEGDAQARADEVSRWRQIGGYLVSNYARAQIEARGLQGADLVVIDEAHKVRNRAAGQTRAIRGIGRSAGALFLVTATPNINGAEDIWTLLDMVDHARWGSFWGFAFRFCEVVDDGYGLKITGLRGGDSGQLEAAIRPYILRREGSLGLRPSEVRTVDYRVSGDQARLYEQMRRDGSCSWRGQDLMALDTLAQFTRLRQLALHPGMVFDGYDGPSKLDALPGIVLERDGQVVVFTAYARLADMAVDALAGVHGVPAVAITGALSETQREANLAAFRSGEARVVVVTHGTGGEGLDLVEADRAVFLDMAWHPAGNEHAERRILRFGQKADRTEVVYLHATGTIEDHVREIVAEKREVTLAEIMARERDRRCRSSGPRP